jgi:hypothetical protein
VRQLLHRSREEREREYRGRGSGLAHAVERVEPIGHDARGGGGGGAGRTRRRQRLSGGEDREMGRCAWATCGECGPAGGEGKWTEPRKQCRVAAKFELN